MKVNHLFEVVLTNQHFQIAVFLLSEFKAINNVLTTGEERTHDGVQPLGVDALGDGPPGSKKNSTRNPKPETRNPKPETRNPKPETREPNPKL